MVNIKVYNGQITEHFNISEFSCHNANEVLINEDVIDHIQRLEKFRAWYNRPIYITSAYRTLKYNRSIGSNDTSQHVLGLACDILYPDEFFSFTNGRREEFLENIKMKWAELCKGDGLRGGIGFYDYDINRFFHIDSRKGTGEIAFWDYR